MASCEALDGLMAAVEAGTKPRTTATVDPLDDPPGTLGSVALLTTTLDDDWSDLPLTPERIVRGHRQLASIERGGLFTELKAAHGSAEITEVTRQRVDWQRQAAQDAGGLGVDEDYGGDHEAHPRAGASSPWASK